MPFLEKSNWVVLIVAVGTLLSYGLAIVPQMLGKPAAQIDWVQPMIVSIVGFVVANIVGNIVVAASNPNEADKKDQRDKEIDRTGERLGNLVIAVGAVIALILAMAKVDHFWIGNAIYVIGIAAAMVASGTKIAAYHSPFQQW
jgi:peptidoglycan/LPS O-acetylase OafA/YrhL